MIDMIDQRDTMVGKLTRFFLFEYVFDVGLYLVESAKFDPWTAGRSERYSKHNTHVVVRLYRT